MFVLGLLCVVSLVGMTTGADTCGGTLTGDTGNITLPADVPKNTKCTWIIKNNNTVQQTTVYIMNLFIQNNDTLLVYAGNTSGAVVANFTASTGPMAVVTVNEVTTIVFSRGNDTMTSKLSAKFDNKVCAMPMSGSRGSVSSPLYEQGKALTCTYTWTLSGSSHDVPILSFPAVTLTSATLTAQFDAAQNTSITGASHGDLFGQANTTTVILTLQVTDKNDSSVAFTAVYQTADKRCSGKFPAGQAIVNVTLPAITVFPTSCYMQLVSTDATQRVMVAEIPDFSMVSDTLVYYDGASQTAPKIGDNSQERTYVTSGAVMTVVGQLGAATNRFDVIEYKQDKFSCMYLLGVNPTTAKTVNGDDVKGELVILQFVTPVSGKQVKIELLTDTILGVNTNVTVSDGDLNELVFVFKKGTVLFPVKTAGQRAIVTVRELGAKQKLSVKATAVDRDCDSTYSKPGVYTLGQSNTTQCTTILSLPDRSKGGMMLDISGVQLCGNASLMVYAGTSTSTPLVTVSSIHRSQPLIQFSDNTDIRLVADFKGNCPVSTVAFTAVNADTLCGSAGKAGTFLTPYFPSRYPINTACSWTVPTATNTTFYLSVNTLKLAPEHNITVQDTHSTQVSYSGSNATLPNDFVTQNVNLSVNFNAGINSVLQTDVGANITYKVLTCGGFVSDPQANITSPPASNKSVDCIWLIKLPDKSKNDTVYIANVSLALQGYAKNSTGMLAIHDGGSVRDSPIQFNLSSPHMMLLSRTNFLVIHYTVPASTNLDAASVLTFNLSYKTHACNKTSQCDNGLCMQPEWRCNNVDNCGDASDEFHCNGTQPQPTPAPRPVPGPAERKKGQVAGYWVAIVLFLGIAVGAALVCLIPVIRRKMRTRRYGQFANSSALET